MMDKIEQQLISDSFDKKYHPAIHAATALGHETLLKYFNKADKTLIYIVAMGMFSSFKHISHDLTYIRSSALKLALGIF